MELSDWMVKAYESEKRLASNQSLGARAHRPARHVQ
jgi:hypothetical protein